MPIYATTEAKDFWENSLKPTTRARSLAAAKFVTLAKSKDEKTWRKASCEAIAEGATLAAKSESFAQFATTLLAQGAAILHAKMEARLIIDAGGGVIENGGICLDRTSGIPFIPGSAVKGCARRYAIHQLSEESDPAAKAKLLAQIAITYGCGDQEWKAGRQKAKEGKHAFARSDFWLAMVPLFDAGPESDAKRDDLWEVVSEESAQLIFQDLGRTRKEPEKSFASQLPNLSGQVAFLPAFPEKDPGIEIDVLTPHHSKYYSGDQPTATDDEDPNPVLFPTVPQNTTFRFPLVPLTQGAWTACPKPLELARSHLTASLELFGLGAKTNAGYGWFRIDTAAEKKIAALLKAQNDADEIKELQPSPEIHLALQARLDKNQLAGDLNAYAFDPPLWPKESTNLYQLTLFHFIRENAPHLAISKKGEKAMSQLSKKLNIQLP